MISSWHKTTVIPDSMDVAIRKIVDAINAGDNVKDACFKIYSVSSGSGFYKAAVKHPEVRQAMEDRAKRKQITKSVHYRRENV